MFIRDYAKSTCPKKPINKRESLIFLHGNFGGFKTRVSSKLPNPIDIDISEYRILKAMVDYVYEHRSKNDFMSKDKR